MPRREPHRRHPGGVRGRRGAGAARADPRGGDRGLRRHAARGSRRPRPTWRPASPTSAAPPSSSRSTRSTSARAGSRRCASSPGCRASGPSRRACAPAGRGPRTSSPRSAATRSPPTLGQDPGHELMGLFETALRELGAKVRDEHGGSFLALARAHGTAEGARRPSSPAGRRGSTSRPTRSCGSRSSSAPRSPPPTSRSPASRPAHDLHRLTLFADNLVPHVLRLDGVLELDDALVARIDAGGADRARLARGGRDPRLRAARRRAARRRPPASRRPPPRSTTTSGTAAPARATRRAPATAPARPPTEADGGRVLEGQRHRLHLLGLDQEDHAGAHRERLARVLDRQPVDDLQRRLALDGLDDPAADLGHPVRAARGR